MNKRRKYFAVVDFNGCEVWLESFSLGQLNRWEDELSTKKACKHGNVYRLVSQAIKRGINPIIIR